MGAAFVKIITGNIILYEKLYLLYIEISKATKGLVDGEKDDELNVKTVNLHCLCSSAFSIVSIQIRNAGIQTCASFLFVLFFFSGNSIYLSLRKLNT